MTTSITIGGTWLQQLNADLRGSDRALAVLGATVLDDKLRELASRYLLPPDDPKSDRLLGRGGKIESFAARIELARRLGLISQDVRKSLDWIREIRNYAAHKTDFAFAADSIRDCVANCTATLQLPPSLLAPPYDNIRGHFIAAVLALAIELQVSAHETSQTTHRPVDALKCGKFSE